MRGRRVFSTPSGRIAHEARDGCALIGAVERAGIVAEAIAREMVLGTPHSQFPETGAPSAPADGHEYADFTDLDDRFFASREDLAALRVAYIRRHSDQFTRALPG
jgi:hypothetical protein